MRTLVLLACLLFPGLGSAASLYRCVNQAGHVSYQSASCPLGDRTDRTIDYALDSMSTPAKPAVHTGMAKRLAAKPRSEARLSHGTIRKQQPSPCVRAKAKRAAELQRLGLKRNFDDLSRIDAAVRAVCNGY